MQPNALPRVLLLATLLTTALASTGRACAQEVAASLVDQARAAARANRNGEAADLFARAISLEPVRRHALLREYADQLTYSSRSRLAVPLYRELLSGARDRSVRLQLLKGLGLALLRSDRPGEAANVYADVLSLDPADADAQGNHARALAWSSRPRAAATALGAWMSANPDDAEARRLLAQVQGWLGQPHLAQATLSALPDDDASALALRGRLEHLASPLARIEFADSSQSDRLNIQQASLTYEHPLEHGRGAVGVQFEHLRFESHDGRRVDIDRPLALGRYRISEAWEINSRLGSDRVDLGTGGGYTRFVHSTWVTWWPSDLLRFDLSAGRMTFDSLRALDLGLTARTLGLSADIVPDERRRASVRVERADISDRNRRDRQQLSAEQRVSLSLGAWVGARWTAFSFDRQLDNGYFNPRRLHSPQVTFRMSPRRLDDDRWDIALESAWGREYAEPGGTQPAWEFGAIGGVRLARDWRLQAGWRRFSTRTSALSGFERTTANIALEGRW